MELTRTNGSSILIATVGLRSLHAMEYDYIRRWTGLEIFTLDTLAAFVMFKYHFRNTVL